MDRNPNDTMNSGTAGQQASDAAHDAQSRMQHGKEAIADKFGSLKDKASGLNSSIADKLEAGADKLRQRTSHVAGAGAGTGAMATDQMGQIGDRAATALQGTADWLREGDLKEQIEHQVKEHPGRTLLIALGVGYVLGKALRR